MVLLSRNVFWAFEINKNENKILNKIKQIKVIHNDFLNKNTIALLCKAFPANWICASKAIIATNFLFCVLWRNKESTLFQRNRIRVSCKIHKLDCTISSCSLIIISNCRNI